MEFSPRVRRKMLTPRLLLPLALAGAASALPAGVGRECGQSVCFSGNFASNAVLQRAPQRAALYGASGANYTVGTPMVLTLSGVGPDGTAYNKSWPAASGADGTWKVLLDPMAAWGNYSATISCPQCTGGQTSATIHSLTFGDVIVCGGQARTAGLTRHRPPPHPPLPKRLSPRQRDPHDLTHICTVEHVD